MSEKTLSRAEVSKHNTEGDCWLIIDGDVYDVTKFLKFHPGGYSVVLEYAGKDATEAFFDMHRVDVLKRYQRLKVGRLAEAVNSNVPSIVSVISKPGFISKVPYAECTAFQGWKSPYFDESHMKFRETIRAMYDTNFTPLAPQYEKSGRDIPLDLYKKAGGFGLFAARIGPGKHTKDFDRWGVKLPGGLPYEKFDFFHELIAHEEHARMGCPGYCDGIGAGLCIGLPPVIHFGQAATRERVVPPVLRGEKRICLAITEPFAGSDVANIRCTAEKTPDGKFYIVNGVKKWITNGHYSDYFVTAVRTGGKGIAGVSLLLIERDDNVNTKKISTSYSPSAGTALITFRNARVPVENLLGKENRGFQCIMYNFNHERWMICVGILRGCRFIVEECMKWSHQRKVFGKSLMTQPVIREKLAHMVAQLEAAQNWLESVTFQMCKMSYKEQSKYLAGPIALLKLQCSRVALSIADDSAQIFGGRAITKTGMGQFVERFITSVKFGAILGGSEEIMADLGIRQAMKYFPKNARL